MTHNVGRPGKLRKDGLISIISCQRTGNRNHKNWMCKPFLSAVISEKKFAVKINTTKANTALNKIIDNKVGETGMFWLENLIKKLPAKKNGIMKANPLKIVLSKRMLGGYRNFFLFWIIGVHKSPNLIAVYCLGQAPNGLRYLRWGGDGEAVQPEK